MTRDFTIRLFDREKTVPIPRNIKNTMKSPHNRLTIPHIDSGIGIIVFVVMLATDDMKYAPTN